jgi:tRNA(Ile)-lysidine synthase
VQSFISKVNQTIKKEGLLDFGEKILLGISGGPDSVALLYSILSLRNKFSLEISLAHVNYQGRRGAIKDELFVRKLALKNALPCYVFRVKDKQILFFEKGEKKEVKIKKALFLEKIKTIGNQENRFRIWRYLFFKWLAQEKKLNKIAVAHQANDQAETIIFHFLRGSGLKGLGGMNYRTGSLVRPLLDVSRELIVRFLLKNKLTFRLDPTNKDLQFTRNRIRKNLIPFLEKEFNPRLVKTINRNAECLRDSQKIITDLATKALQKATLTFTPFKEMTLDWPQLNKEITAPLRTEILRLIAWRLKGDIVDLGRSQSIEIWKILATSPKIAPFVFLKKLTVQKEDGRVCFKRLNRL